MSRESRYDNNGAYRVVGRYDKNPDRNPVYFGPYATKGAAKGVRTTQQRINNRYNTGVTYSVEVIVGPWKALNE